MYASPQKNHLSKASLVVLSEPSEDGRGRRGEAWWKEASGMEDAAGYIFKMA